MTGAVYVKLDKVSTFLVRLRNFALGDRGKFTITTQPRRKGRFNHECHLFDRADLGLCFEAEQP